MSNKRPEVGGGRALSGIFALAALGCVAALGVWVATGRRPTVENARELGDPAPSSERFVTFLPETQAPSELGGTEANAAAEAPVAALDAGEERKHASESMVRKTRVPSPSNTRMEGFGGIVGAKGNQMGSGGLGVMGSGLGSNAGGTDLGAVAYGSGRRDGGSARSVRLDAALAVTMRPDPDGYGVGAGGDGDDVLTDAAVDARSTFAADVDTGSYTYARRVLRGGEAPAPESVRVEEFINYFRYDYPQPIGDRPLQVDAEVVPHPTRQGRHILRVGVQARTVHRSDRKPIRLTFLVDTSGSMRGSDRLGLAQRAMSEALRGLGSEDTVAIVTYAGSTQVVLPPTPATRRQAVERAIRSLRAGGGTAMDSGMALAYAQAEESFAEGAENRVVVLSDGDANIGRTSAEDMLETIRRHAEGGVTLTTVGLGSGNYHDARMERLADAGDGMYVYIDDEDEVKRVFGARLGATLESVARDVKLQLELNPNAVKSWRQVGYANRRLADTDFRNDAVDAGEVGSGHQVTALFELTLRPTWRSVEVLGTVHLRAKPPGPDRPAAEWSESVGTGRVRNDRAFSADTQMALAAMFLADGLHKRDWSHLRHAQKMAEGLDAEGRRGAAELVELTRAAEGVMEPG